MKFRKIDLLKLMAEREGPWLRGWDGLETMVYLIFHKNGTERMVFGWLLDGSDITIYIYYFIYLFIYYVFIYIYIYTYIYIYIYIHIHIYIYHDISIVR